MTSSIAPRHLRAALVHALLPAAKDARRIGSHGGRISPAPDGSLSILVGPDVDAASRTLQETPHTHTMPSPERADVESVSRRQGDRRGRLLVASGRRLDRLSAATRGAH